MTHEHDDGQGPMTGHAEYTDLVAAYALDALDDAERPAFEAHLEACADCQAALADLRRVTAGIGLASEPETPPASLRDRVLTQAAADPRPWAQAPAPTPGPASAESRRGPRSGFLPWMLAAAAMLIAFASVSYTLALRGELDGARVAVDAARRQVDTLEARLVGLEQTTTRLRQVVSIVTASDVRQARLTGSGAASGASGLAYWSESLGLVFNAVDLPTLEAGRGYELWVIPPGGAPVSLGMLAVSIGGTSSHSVPLQDGLDVGTVAVTVEPGTGAPGGAPTGPIVLAGTLGS